VVVTASHAVASRGAAPGSAPAVASRGVEWAAALALPAAAARAAVDLPAALRAMVDLGPADMAGAQEPADRF